MSVSVNYGGAYAFYVIPAAHNGRRSHHPNSVLTRVHQYISRNTGRIALLNRGIGSFNCNVNSQCTFSGLLQTYKSVRKLRHIHFASPRPTTFASSIVTTVTRAPGIVRRLRVPLRSNSSGVLHTVHHSCHSTGFLSVLHGIHRTVPSTRVDASVVIKFPNRASRSFRTAVSIIHRTEFRSTFAFRCSPHPKAPTTRVRRISRRIIRRQFSQLIGLRRRVARRRLTGFRNHSIRIVVAKTRNGGSSTARHIANHRQANILIRVNIPSNRPVPRVNSFIATAIARTNHRGLVTSPSIGTNRACTIHQ